MNALIPRPGNQAEMKSRMEDGVLPAGSAAIRQVVTIACNDNVTVPVKELRVGISPLFPLT